jgi:hypothetical protein
VYMPLLRCIDATGPVRPTDPLHRTVILLPLGYRSVPLEIRSNRNLTRLTPGTNRTSFIFSTASRRPSERRGHLAGAGTPWASHRRRNAEGISKAIGTPRASCRTPERRARLDGRRNAARVLTEAGTPRASCRMPERRACLAGHRLLRGQSEPIAGREGGGELREERLRQEHQRLLVGGRWRWRHVLHLNRSNQSVRREQQP